MTLTVNKKTQRLATSQQFWIVPIEYAMEKVIKLNANNMSPWPSQKSLSMLFRWLAIGEETSKMLTYLLFDRVHG